MMIDLSLEEMALIGESLACNTLHHENVLKAMQVVPPKRAPQAEAYIESKLRTLRNLHVTVINARIKAGGK